MNISTKAFLQHVLPTEGYYCCVTFPFGDPKGIQHFFTPILDVLVERILVDDANGHTVYHACCTYKSPDRRTQDNARFARALWIDIDCELEEAEKHLDTLASQLPDPVVVESGRGLHCYWPFATNVDTTKWWDLADGLRDLCFDLGIPTLSKKKQADGSTITIDGVDHSRTCDSASILRPAGTANRKYGDTRIVRCR